MKSSLMIIESPNKIQTIGKYLSGTNIKIIATIGHFRELNSKKFKGLGFDRNTYETSWVNDSEKTIKGKKIDIIETINKEADKCDQIYLSTDPDREGEAISWHIKEILTEQNKKKCLRIVFNEITKPAIEQALKQPRDIDQNQINSYLARKLLDRKLGFQLSGFVSRTPAGGKSAGRVQSIALKFLKDKHVEIENFVPDHWFNLRVVLKNKLELTLKKLANPEEYEFKQIPNNSFVNFAQEEQIKQFKDSLSCEYKLISISDARKETKKSPTPFKTSTLQSTAINKLHMSAKAVERASQTLYEGVQVDEEFISLITYPRTDRSDLSETFVSEAKSFLISNFGKNYWKGQLKNKSKKLLENENLVQGAHEAIRPTFLNITPDQLKGKIGESEHKLYTLIWVQTMSSLMSDAEYENVLYSFENNKHIFTANYRTEKFDGYQALTRKFFLNSLNEDFFPTGLQVGESYEKEITDIKRVDKRPPSLYTEASLIDSLESKGIGRPSTYSHIVNIVLDRGYAIKESNKLVITELGLNMSKILEKYFPTIMQYDYTKNMEQNLDNISENKSDWKEFLNGVFDLFEKELEKAKQSAEDSGKICKLCGGKMLYKVSKKGNNRFLGCSNYPKCNHVENLNIEITKENCPECKSVLIKRKNKWGKEFISCSNYPNCKYVKRDENYFTPEQVDKHCPKCNSPLFKRKNINKDTFFLGCGNYPKCKYLESLNKSEPEFLSEDCPECHNTLMKVMGKWNKPYIRCSNKDCKYKRSIKPESENDE